jgi:hypothetical protein
MRRAISLSTVFALPLLVLPATHVILVALTMVLSRHTPGGAYYRIFGVDPFSAMVLMVYDGTPAVVVSILVLGTAWWYFIGRIGWESSQGRLSRFGAGLGALLTLFFGVIGVTLSIGVVNEDMRDGALSAGAIFQYVLVGLLCLGAFVAASSSAKHALRTKKSGALPLQ